MYYRIDGAGPTVLLLIHGAMCGHRDWERMTAHLTGEFTVVRVDLAGHGLSPAPPHDCSMARWAGDVSDLAERFDSRRVVLVGHSLGGRVVAEAAATPGHAFAGVVLVDGSRMVYARDDTAPPTKPLTRVDLDELIGPYADPATRRAIREGVDRDAKSVFAAVRGELSAWDRDRADLVYGSLAGTPLLAVQSTYRDQVTRRYSFQSASESSRYLDYLRETVPGAEICIIPHAGHFTMIEKPADVAAAIARFARRATTGIDV